MILYIRVFILGKQIDNLKETNKNKIIIGLSLKTQFIQNLISRDLKYFKSFIEENEKYFTTVDIHTLTSGIEDLIGVMYNFTDVIFFDFDKDENYLQYNEEFY